MATSPTRLTGLVSGMDTESLIKGLVNAQKLKNKRVEDKNTLLTWEQDKWKDLNAKLYKLYTDDLNKMRLKGSYQAKKVTSSNDSLTSVTVNNTAPEGAHSLIINKLAKSQFVTGGKIAADKDGNTITPADSTKLTALGITEGTIISIGKAGALKTLTIDANTTIDDFVNKAKDAGINASFDTTQGRLFLSSKESGEKNGFQITAVDSAGVNANALLSKIGLDALNPNGTKINPASTTSTVVAASDSEVIYNDAKITSSSNIINVNGLNITLKGADPAQTISLNVTKDTKAAYDMVKNFIKSYNDVLNEMNTLYYADSAKDYAPLSDDEKESMTDDQIAKWETKIKDSILRRDSTLGSVIDTMKNDMMSTVDIDGKKYALSTYGIQTSKDYLEKGLLHIYGDKDDPVYAAEDDKLMKALEKDPDKVIDVLTGITQKLYGDMYDKMKAIPNVRSALTFYDDKLMTEQQRQYKKQISEQEVKLTDMENKYYKQFSEMESAMSKMQSQQNALAGMLGTGK